MFRPSYKRSSTFSLLDPDMWDTKSDFAAQVGFKKTLFDF